MFNKKKILKSEELDELDSNATLQDMMSLFSWFNFWYYEVEAKLSKQGNERSENIYVLCVVINYIVS